MAHQDVPVENIVIEKVTVTEWFFTATPHNTLILADASHPK